MLQEAGAQTDSLYMSLDSTTVVSMKSSSSVQMTSEDVLEVDVQMVQSLPKFLGTTDPVHFVKLLPGVQTSTELDSGLHVHGCDASHNEISVAGVPVFGVNHLFSFSVFNPEHYSQMQFSHSSSSNRLGGTFRMALPDTLSGKVSGKVSLGIMASQGTVGLRLGEKFHLRVSARQSYMNLLYKRWMKLNDSQVRYGFGDYNVTCIWDSGSGDRIWLDGYFGKDRVGMSEQTYDISLALDWGNYIGALHWEHKGENLSHRHTLYSSGYLSKCALEQSRASAYMPSFINTVGYRGSTRWNGFDAGAELVYYRVMPQYPNVSGIFDDMKSEKEIQNALEGTLNVDYRRKFAYDWEVKAGVKGVLFYNLESGLSGGVTPDVSLSYDARRLGKVALSYGWHQQYLFQTGLSNMGFPVEFWFVAGSHSRPQFCQNVALMYDLEFYRSMFDLTVSLYYKQLYNQVEYKGDLLDMFQTRYDLDDNLLKGRGWNYGLNVMMHKQSGSLTGWLSYSLGRALRRFENQGYTGVYPANHERIHELNAVCSYKLRKWDFGGTFIYASGLPFTAPESYYMSSGRVIARYGDYNAARMRPYIRLDLSVTYFIRKDDARESGINLSVYNVLGRRNDVHYRLNVNKQGQIAYRLQTFMMTFVPSLSYHYRF